MTKILETKTKEIYEIDTKGKSQCKLRCPACDLTNKDKREKSLSWNDDLGTGHCFRPSCDARFVKYDESRVYEKKEYRLPDPLDDIKPYSERMAAFFMSRGLFESTMKRFNIVEKEHYFNAVNEKRNAILFPYYRDKHLVNIKYRDGEKNFMLETGAELIPFNLDNIKGKKEIIITEGEFDCMSIEQVGFTHVISVPNGASSNLDYLDRFIESHFEDKDEIVIAVDTDKKGLDLRNELVRRLGAERCRIVTYVEGCKDINEVLCKPGHGSTAVLQAIEDAQYVKIEGVFEVIDVRSQLDILFNEGLQKGATIGHPHFDDLISWVTGRLCVVTGIPSHGKSEFLDEIVYRLNLKHKWRAAYFSPENHPLEWHISKVVSKLTGKKFEKDKLSHEEYKKSVNYTNDNYFFIAPMDSSDIDTILEKAASLVRRKGIKMLVIDPYNKLEHNLPKGLNETQYISLFLDKLISFARKYNILCFLVAHPVKMKVEDGVYEVPSLYSISGSSHFYNKTDFGICVYRNFVTNNVEVYVQKVKFKHLGKPGISNFHYNLENGRYVQAYNDQPPAWDNTNHLTKQLYNDELNIEEPEFDFDDGDLPM